mmetsp:Transcript_48621/g.128937  ORF Transcript_48621/g.128937 Transcript_48621/m.128937 type:complete len:87 (+) Transcript_48621:297-557(+)
MCPSTFQTRQKLRQRDGKREGARAEGHRPKSPETPEVPTSQIQDMRFGAVLLATFLIRPVGVFGVPPRTMPAPLTSPSIGRFGKTI